jgi:hypothetical protein
MPKRQPRGAGSALPADIVKNVYWGKISPRSPRPAVGKSSSRCGNHIEGLKVITITMNSFTLLYFFYSAKLSSQASIYFIWLVDSSSRTIAFIAAAVAVFAVFPFFHVIVYIFSAKPLSNAIFIAYLCFR